MASIYDWANITAGDPIGRVERQAGKAAADLEQYKHQKEMIEEINAAYKSAQDKMKKGKKGFGFGGSLLGGLLGMSLGPVGAALVAAGTSGLAEKIRQNTYDPTKELEKIDKKYKGRKLGEGIEGDIEEIESNLDSAVLQDALISGLSSYALGNLEFAPGEQLETGVVEEIAGDFAGTDLVSEEVADNLILDQSEEIAGNLISDQGSLNAYSANAYDGTPLQDLTQGSSYEFGFDPGTVEVPSITPMPSVGATSAIPGDYIPPSVSMGDTNIGSLLEAKGIDISKLKEGLDGPLGDFLKNNPWMGQTLQGLLRYGGTPLVQDLMMNEYQAPQFAADPFRNRFGGY